MASASFAASYPQPASTSHQTTVAFQPHVSLGIEGTKLVAVPKATVSTLAHRIRALASEAYRRDLTSPEIQFFYKEQPVTAETKLGSAADDCIVVDIRHSHPEVPHRPPTMAAGAAPTTTTTPGATPDAATAKLRAEAAKRWERLDLKWTNPDYISYQQLVDTLVQENYIKSAADCDTFYNRGITPRAIVIGGGLQGLLTAIALIQQNRASIYPENPIWLFESGDITSLYNISEATPTLINLKDSLATAMSVRNPDDVLALSVQNQDTWGFSGYHPVNIGPAFAYGLGGASTRFADPVTAAKRGLSDGGSYRDPLADSGLLYNNGSNTTSLMGSVYEDNQFANGGLTRGQGLQGYANVQTLPESSSTSDQALTAALQTNLASFQSDTRGSGSVRPFVSAKGSADSTTAQFLTRANADANVWAALSTRKALCDLLASDPTLPGCFYIFTRTEITQLNINASLLLTEPYALIQGFYAYGYTNSPPTSATYNWSDLWNGTPNTTCYLCTDAPRAVALLQKSYLGPYTIDLISAVYERAMQNVGLNMSGRMRVFFAVQGTMLTPPSSAHAPYQQPSSHALPEISVVNLGPELDAWGASAANASAANPIRAYPMGAKSMAETVVVVSNQYLSLLASNPGKASAMVDQIYNRLMSLFEVEVATASYGPLCQSHIKREDILNMLNGLSTASGTVLMFYFAWIPLQPNCLSMAVQTSGSGQDYYSWTLAPNWASTYHLLAMASQIPTTLARILGFPATAPDTTPPSSPILEMWDSASSSFVSWPTDPNSSCGLPSIATAPVAVLDAMVHDVCGGCGYGTVVDGNRNFLSIANLHIDSPACFTEAPADGGTLMIAEQSLADVNAWKQQLNQQLSDANARNFLLCQYLWNEMYTVNVSITLSSPAPSTGPGEYVVPRTSSVSVFVQFQNLSGVTAYGVRAHIGIAPLGTTDSNYVISPIGGSSNFDYEKYETVLGNTLAPFATSSTTMYLSLLDSTVPIATTHIITAEYRGTPNSNTANRRSAISVVST